MDGSGDGSATPELRPSVPVR